MYFDHFDRLFVYFALGFGLLLAGGLNLAFGRSGRRAGLRTAVTLAACGAVVAGLCAVTRTGLAVRTGGVLLGVLTVAALAGSERFWRQIAVAFCALRAPAPRWGLVALGGLGTVVAGGIAFDKSDEAVAEQQMRDLEFVIGKPVTQPSAHGRASTDRGTQIVLKEPVALRAPGELVAPEEKTIRESPYRDQLIRRSEPNDGSNCHGWVFTGGKFFLAPEDVEAILKENSYQEVPQPLPGDLIVYRQSGAVAHTAVVRYVTEGQPVLVEGKWGTLGVYLHPADKSFYGTEFTFHRSARAGHLLVGFGGTPGPAETISATTE